MNLTKTLRAARMGNQHIVTPRLKAFMRDNPNLVVEPWVAEKISEQITKQPRVRSGSFSSSSAGDCPRKQIFQYQGIEPEHPVSATVQNIFYDGTWRHLRWQAVLLQAGIITEIEYPLPWEEMNSVGTMDGLGVVPDDHPNEKWRELEFGWELKGANTYAFKSAVSLPAPPAKYNPQVHRYFLSGGFDLFVFIMEDKNTQEWAEWVVEPDEKILDEQREELEMLNGYVARQEIPPMLDGCRAGTDPRWAKGWCPFAGNGGVCVRTNTWEEGRDEDTDA